MDVSHDTISLNRMQKTIVGIIILVVIIGGVIWLISTSRTDNADVPVENGDNATATSTDSNATTTIDTSATTTVSTGTVKEFTVTGSPFSFAPFLLTVKKGDTVKITFINAAGFHDLVLDAFDVRTKPLNAGEQETIEFVADKAGNFEYYCSIGTHRQQGMKVTFTVTE